MRHDLPDSTRMPRRWGGSADGLGASLIDLLVVKDDRDSMVHWSTDRTTDFARNAPIYPRIFGD